MTTSETKNNQKHYTVDATERAFGRVASEVATLLRGKHEATFLPHVDPKIFVTVSHLQFIKFSGVKMRDKTYYHHTGHPGGLREQPLSDLWEKNPVQVFAKAVERMLPNNKLRKLMMKRLTVNV